MDKNAILIAAVTIFFNTLVFVILEVLTQSVNVFDIIVFTVANAVGLGIIYYTAFTIIAERTKKSK